MRNGILIAAAVLILQVSFVGLLFYHLLAPRIEDGVEVTSPDGRYVASGYNSFGAAFSRDETIIQIRPKSQSWNEIKKNAVLDVNMRLPRNKHPFNISWTQNKELTITYTPGDFEFQKFTWGDITIKYIAK